MMLLFVFVLMAVALTPDLAAAAPVVGALTTFFTSVGVGAAFAASLATFVVQTAVGVAFSLVAQLFAEKPKIRPQGIQTEQTTTGDTTPQKFVVGRYALEGHAVAPAYSHGPDNTFLTYILEVSNIPVAGLTGRVAIDGQWYDYDTENPHADYGFPFPDLFHAGHDRAWIKFYDGTQTAADPMLVDKYSSHPDRPWTNDHILEGSAYAVMTFRLAREVFSGLPAVRFEIDGISLYDPRKDTTVGGSGAHRWADPSTWELTKNPQVINYNVLRGITMPSGDIYGGLVSPDDLPLASWFAAMNECDELIGARTKYEAGFEVDVSVEPFDVIQEMNRASFTQISEFGGIFIPRTGAPAAPVLSMTDADIVITQPEDLEPFPGLEGTNNAITGTYLEPNDVWQGREADPIYNAQWEEDDGDRRLTRDMSLPAVSNKSQAQHLLNSYINDERRFRTHRLVLPSSYAVLEPLDTISWTSSYNGYTSKVFEVVEVEDRLDTMLQFLTLRERDASDVAWTSGDDVPSPASFLGVEDLTPAVPNIAVVAFAVQDNSGSDRRPGIRITWDEDDAGSSQSLIYQVRLKDTQELVANGTVDVGEEKAQVTEGILPGEAYELRARFVTGNDPFWSSWEEVTAAEIRAALADFAFGIGSNLLSNTDFIAGLEGWKLFATGDQNSETDLEIRAAGESWSGSTYPTLQMRQAGNGSTGTGFLRCRPETVEGETMPGVPCSPGEWLEASVQLSAHRCEGKILVQFYDKDGVSVGSTTPDVATIQSSSDNPDEWPRYVSRGQAPAGTAYATFHMQKSATESGTNSVLIIHKPQLVKTHAGATEPTPYSRGGSTLITGNMIKTGDFNAAGLAIFGGDLKSDNFDGTINGSGEITDTGTEGWAITEAGKAVFQNLVAREWLIENSVSDTLLDSELGLIDYAATSTWIELLTLSAGPVGPSDQWHVHWFASIKGGNSHFRMRIKTDGIWSSHHVMGERVINQPSGWQYRWMETVFGGNLDDIEVSVWGNQSTANTLRDIGLKATRVTR